MKNSSLVILSAGFMVLGICEIARAQTVPQHKAPNPRSEPQPEYRPIATGRQRISRNRETIAIFQGSQDVVFDYFTDLVIAKIIEPTVGPQDLNGVTVSLARDSKVKGRWNIFQGGASDGEALTLPENVLCIRKVIASTKDYPVKVKIDGRVYDLEPGEFLFLLG